VSLLPRGRVQQAVDGFRADFALASAPVSVAAASSACGTVLVSELGDLVRIHATQQGYSLAVLRDGGG
jgi:hypothetical protein